MCVGVYRLLTGGLPLTPTLSPPGGGGAWGWRFGGAQDPAGTLAQNRGEA